MGLKYSILTFNFNGYENFREIKPEVYNPDVEYVYLTDNESITSNTWNVKYLQKPDDCQNYFEFVYRLRYNPFDYVTNDIVMIIDGSVELNMDLSMLIQYFVDKNYDYAVMPHFEVNTALQQYLQWAYLHIWDLPQLEKAIKFLNEQNYDVFNYKGQYIATVQIQKKSSFTDQLNALTFQFCKMIGDIEPKSPIGIERIDQIVLSFVLNKWFSDKKVLTLNSDMLNENEFTWYNHNENIPPRHIQRIVKPYLFNKECILYSIIDYNSNNA